LRDVLLPQRTGMLQQENRSLPPTRQQSGLGRSDQFSALLATVRELIDPEDIRPIIIFQSDGDEIDRLQPPNPNRYDPDAACFLCSKRTLKWESRVKQYSLDDVYAAVQKARATVYAVIPGPRFVEIAPSGQPDRAQPDPSGPTFFGIAPSEQLERSQRDLSAHGMGNQPREALDPFVAFKVDCQLAMARAATVSGGWTAFLEDPKQADTIYSRILADMNSRYVIGYYPTNKTRDGARRMVAVQVRNHPDYTVTGRKAYYAPGPD